MTKDLRRAREGEQELRMPSGSNRTGVFRNRRDYPGIPIIFTHLKDLSLYLIYLIERDISDLQLYKSLSWSKFITPGSKSMMTETGGSMKSDGSPTAFGHL